MAMQAVKDGESTISEAAVITEDNDERQAFADVTYPI